VSLALRLALIGTLITTWACTLERRPDLEPENGAASVAGQEASARSTADSVDAVMAAFHEALALGDGARVTALTAPGAVLVDQEEGVRWERATDSNPDLPSPLALGGDGLGWRMTDASFTPLGDSASLLVREYRARVEGEEVPWSAVESLVLVHVNGAWRVRYLHQSRGPASNITSR
jgi:hypothetical protein